MVAWLSSKWSRCDDVIRSGIADGLTNREIAAKIPGANKNVVAARIRVMRAHGDALVRPEKVAAPKVKVSRQAPEPVKPPETAGVTFMEHRDGTCLFPVGERDGVALFCGAPAEDVERAGARSRWCPYHYAVGHVPAPRPRASGSPDGRQRRRGFFHI